MSDPYLGLFAFVSDMGRGVAMPGEALALLSMRKACAEEAARAAAAAFNKDCLGAVSSGYGCSCTDV